MIYFKTQQHGSLFSVNDEESLRELLLTQLTRAKLIRW